MIKRVVAVAAMAAAVLPVSAIGADAAPAVGPNAAFTMAVYGDSPYGTKPSDTAEFTATPAFIDTVNADPDVSSVVHVGDIHSGKQYCTQAYDQSIYDAWTHFADPLVYTPGDNEWADCHKAGEGGGTYNATTGQIDYVKDASGNPVDYANGNPAANLQLIRSIFFAHAGDTLGGGHMHVLSQAQLFDPRHPADRDYVENVLWVRNGIVFVTVNVPGGSNNDADVWYGTPTASPAQLDDTSNRTAADIRWLQTAFAAAGVLRAHGVVVVTQADMWDLDGKTAAHLSNYEPVIQTLATETTRFGKPVLLFNGDSHDYRSDNPLVANSPCSIEVPPCATDAWTAHPTYNVPNFHRVVVHGSTFPLEWLKLTVDPKADAPNGATAFGPFSWQRMPQAQLTPAS